MIKNIKSIKSLAVFKSFDWDSSVKDKNGNVKNFTKINIFYGRNYSGKTTLSRVARALEIGELSDKYNDYEFKIELDDGTTIDIRVRPFTGKLLETENVKYDVVDGYETLLDLVK